MNVVIDRIGSLENKVSGVEKELTKNSQKSDVLTEQFGDVTSMVIDHDQRITKLDGDVAGLQSSIH